MELVRKNERLELTIFDPTATSYRWDYMASILLLVPVPYNLPSKFSFLHAIRRNNGSPNEKH